MRFRTPARLALATLVAAAPLTAQQGTGDGFLFRAPPGSLTVYGGLAAPLATGGVFALTTSELTVDRGDFRSGTLGFDLAIAVRPRLDLVLGVSGDRSRTPSEFRDWVDNNDQPIEQTTDFRRTPFIASLRYYLADRGRTIGSVAWVPASFVPFVSLGGGAVRYRFEQAGDFVDTTSLNIFSDRLTASGWAGAVQGGAGAQWSLGPRWLMTGELRYLHAKGTGDRPYGDFEGYQVNLSGLSTVVGLTLRF